jgi:hypothetical protein
VTKDLFYHCHKLLKSHGYLECSFDDFYCNIQRGKRMIKLWWGGEKLELKYILDRLEVILSKSPHKAAASIFYMEADKPLKSSDISGAKYYFNGRYSPALGKTVLDQAIEVLTPLKAKFSQSTKTTHVG